MVFWCGHNIAAVLFLSFFLLSCEGVPGHNNPVGPDRPDFVLQSGGYFSAVFGGSGVYLAWLDSSFHEDGFLIERALDSSGVFTEVARTRPDTSSYYDSLAVEAFTAHYRVSPFVLRDGVTIAGESVGGSVYLSFFHHSGLWLGVVSERKIMLGWDDLFSFETGYEIERESSGSGFAVVDTVGANITQFIDEDSFALNALYAYRVRPLKGDVRGPASPIRTIPMTIQTPERPLASINDDGDSVMLSWSWDYRAERYKVERDQGHGFVVVADLSPDTTWFRDAAFDTVSGYQAYRIRTLISNPSAAWVIRRKPAFVKERILQGHLDAVTKVSFTPDGQWLLSGGLDRVVKVWAVSSGTLLRTISVSSNVTSLDVHPTLPWMIVTTEGSVFGNGETAIYDYLSGGHVRTISPSNYLGAFSPDGNLIGTGGENMHGLILETESSDTVARLTVPRWEGGLYSLRFRPNSDQVAIGDRGGYVHLFDISTETFAKSFLGSSDITSFAFSMDGAACILPGVAGGGGGASLFDVLSGTLIWSISTDRVREAAFMPDGSILTASAWVNHASLWDPVAKQLIITATGHSDHIMSVAASPDGTRIATASADRTVRIWLKGMKWTDK